MGPSNSGKSTLAAAIGRARGLAPVYLDQCGQDSMKWDMIHHILVATRRNRRRYQALFERISLPKVRLASTRELVRFYRAEGLER